MAVVVVVGGGGVFLDTHEHSEYSIDKILIVCVWHFRQNQIKSSSSKTQLVSLLALPTDKDETLIKRLNLVFPKKNTTHRETEIINDKMDW